MPLKLTKEDIRDHVSLLKEAIDPDFELDWQSTSFLESLLIGFYFRENPLTLNREFGAMKSILEKVPHLVIHIFELMHDENHKIKTEVATFLTNDLSTSQVVAFMFGIESSAKSETDIILQKEMQSKIKEHQKPMVTESFYHARLLLKKIGDERLLRTEAYKIIGLAHIISPWLGFREPRDFNKNSQMIFAVQEILRIVDGRKKILRALIDLFPDMDDKSQKANVHRIAILEMTGNDLNTQIIIDILCAILELLEEKKEIITPNDIQDKMLDFYEQE